MRSMGRISSCILLGYISLELLEHTAVTRLTSSPPVRGEVSGERKEGEHFNFGRTNREITQTHSDAQTTEA